MSELIQSFYGSYGDDNHPALPSFTILAPGTQSSAFNKRDLRALTWPFGAQDR